MIARFPHALAADGVVASDFADLSLPVKVAKVLVMQGVVVPGSSGAVGGRADRPYGAPTVCAHSRTGTAKSRPPQAHSDNLTAAGRVR